MTCSRVSSDGGVKRFDGMEVVRADARQCQLRGLNLGRLREMSVSSKNPDSRLSATGYPLSCAIAGSTA
jgi:hypothetical protein